MESEARYAWVGAIVVLLVAALAGTLAWLRSNATGADAQQYRIYFERQSLDGVEPRGDVRMRGIKVGSVLAVRLSPRRPGVGEVLIAITRGTPVDAETKAVVDRNLMTGLASLDLVGGTGHGPPAMAPAGEPYPVIAEGVSTTQQLSSTVADLARHADEALQGANAVLSPGNRAALSETLGNLAAASRGAHATMSNADAALASVRRAAEGADKLMDRYGELGTDVAATVHEAREAIGKAGADVDRVARHADDAMAGGGDELRETARSVRAAADSMGAAADRLRDPAQAVLGPAPAALGPGERAP